MSRIDPPPVAQYDSYRSKNSRNKHDHGGSDKACCSQSETLLYHQHLSRLDIPMPRVRKSAAGPNWSEMEEGLNKDMTILVDYIRKWRLQLSIGKRVSAACHHNNREAKEELDVFVDNKRLMFQQAPKYLGVRRDRMLNFKQHIEEVAGNVTSRVSLIRRLADRTWGASAETLQISTQALVFPLAEYWATVWSRSTHV